MMVGPWSEENTATSGEAGPHTHTIQELSHHQDSRAQSSEGAEGMRSQSIYLSTDGTGELEDVQSNVQQRLQDTESKVTTGAAKTLTAPRPGGTPATRL